MQTIVYVITKVQYKTVAKLLEKTKKMFKVPYFRLSKWQLCTSMEKKTKKLTPLARSQNSHYDLSTSHFIIRIHESYKRKRKTEKGKGQEINVSENMQLFLVTVSKRRKTGRLNLI